MPRRKDALRFKERQTRLSDTMNRFITDFDQKTPKLQWSLGVFAPLHLCVSRIVATPFKVSPFHRPKQKKNFLKRQRAAAFKYYRSPTRLPTAPTPPKHPRLTTVRPEFLLSPNKRIFRYILTRVCFDDIDTRQQIFDRNVPCLINPKLTAALR